MRHPPSPSARRARAVAVVATEFQNYFRSMTAVEAAALDAALRGRNFSQICEDLRALAARR